MSKYEDFTNADAAEYFAKSEHKDFLNGSGESANEYLADEMPGELIDYAIALQNTHELNDADRWLQLMKEIEKAATEALDARIEKYCSAVERSKFEGMSGKV